MDCNLIHAIHLKVPMSLIHIRCIAKQLFEVLAGLKDEHLIYSLIEPDNAMAVDFNEEALKVTLLGSKLAIPVSCFQNGMNAQPLRYRAPEVLLGLPCDEAIDVWGSGCVLSFLFLGKNLFPVSSEYHMMGRIVDLLGQPEGHLLDAGKHSNNYFTKDCNKWRLMTAKDYKDRDNDTLASPGDYDDSLSSLYDLIDLRVTETMEDAEYEDKLQFVHFLQRTLDVDGKERISANQALHHPFITMDHLRKHADSCHYAMSEAIMELLQKSAHSSVPESSGFWNGGQTTLPNEAPMLHTYCGKLSPIPEEDNKDLNVSSSNQEIAPASASCCSDEDEEDPADTYRGLRTNWVNVLRFFRQKNSLCSCCRPRVED